MVVGKEDDQVKSSMGNMPSLLHEEDEDLPSSSTFPSLPQPASGQSASQPEDAAINAEGIVKLEAEPVDDASNGKGETGEEQHQQGGGERTLSATQSNDLPVTIESPPPAEGDKEEGNESEEVGREHQQPDSVDEASELRVPSVPVFGAPREDDVKSDVAEMMEEDRVDEGKLNDSHVSREVDDSPLNEDEGKDGGVEVEGGEDTRKKEEFSKDPNLDNSVEQKEDIEKQDDVRDEIDTAKKDEYGDKGDESGAHMEDENDDNKDKVEAGLENVNDNSRGELEADRTHEKDQCLDVVQIDEKCDFVNVVASMLVSESEGDKKDGDVNASALDAMTGVSALENSVEDEKDGALADSGLASISDVVKEEEKDEVMNATEPVSDNSAVAHTSDGIGAKEDDTSVAAPVACDLVVVKEFTDTKNEEKDDSLPANESKVDEEKNEEMAQGSELHMSDREPDKLEVGGESEQVIVKDDFDNEEMEVEGEGTPIVDKGMNIEAEATGGSSSGKRKRARGAGAVGRASTKKKIEEDVCFICFDGGDLVLCDRRGCPKAYHPSCVNRDEAFFQTKGRWNCGWHLCSICEKNAYFMCYTCTFSLCKGCVKDSVFYSISGNKGFCETCMKMVLLIENNEEANKEAQVDFSDKNSWEFLFKDYWLDMKANLQLSSQEIAQAKSIGKVSEIITSKQDLVDENNGDNPATVKVGTPQKRKYKKRSKSLAKDEDSQSGSDNSPNHSGSRNKTRKTKKQLKTLVKEGDLHSTGSVVGGEWMSSHGNSEWASKELLEFVMHMKDGDASVASQFDVQALLLEYIKRYKLRDPRRKSQIICDSRLQNLFGKPRVGHFEMLKLLESHFLAREECQADDFQGSTVDNEENMLDTEENTEAHVSNKDKRRKMRKKGNERGLQSNADDYAAIDNHNIGLIFLRRNLVEALLENSDNFQEKVTGSFVRIRISGAGQKQDMYRLVQVVGTSKADGPYKVGKKTTDFMLEIQNLDKTESISIDIISNQEFTEDECKRLRQSIKVGLINRMTVGDIQEKAMELQVVRVNDWLEAETVRLSHLCDRASETGRRKELRECVEKLQLLKTPEERQRRLEEFPKVHTDPKMDPSYESEDDADQMDNKKPDNSLRPRGSGFSRRGRDPISPHKEGTISGESWSGAKSYASTSRELTRNLSIGSSATRREDANMPSDESLLSHGRNRPSQQLSWEKQRTAPSSEMVVSENPPATPSTINDTEKMWHYKDPSGKVQGPFSMAQLRKWNGNGYFPSDLKIWKSSEKEDDSVLLTDALIGKFQQVLNRNVANVQMPLTTSLSASSMGSLRKSEGPSQIEEPVLSVNVPKTATNGWGSDFSVRNDSANLPSPTPGSARIGGISGQAAENKLVPVSSTKPSFGPDVSLAAYNQKTNAYRNDTHDSFSGINVISRQEVGIGPSSTQLFHYQTNSSGGLHVAQATRAQQTDVSPSSSMPSLVHLQQPPTNTAGSHTWSSTPSNQMTLPVQQQTHGQWSSQSGSFPNPGFSGSTTTNQLNMQPSSAQSLSWGQQPGNPNMGWGGSVPGYTHTSSHHSGGQGPTPGNPGWVRSGGGNPGWVTAAQGQAPGNVNPGLVSANQAPAGNVWPVLGQGSSASGSASQGRVAPSGGLAARGNEQSHNGGRYSQGGSDSGSGGHKPWNRQSSFGQKVCNYYLSGHCKKGSACDYMHPQR